MSLAEELLKTFKLTCQGLLLVPGDGGCFEVERDGVLVFSKLAAERFPEDGEILEILNGDAEPVVA